MKFGPPRRTHNSNPRIQSNHRRIATTTLLHSKKNNNNFHSSSSSSSPSSSSSTQPLPLPSLPSLPPAALRWSTTSSIAAAISYADRGTSAIVANSLLEELHWTEGQLGEVQGAFFVGYALTQVLGGILGGGASFKKKKRNAVKKSVVGGAEDSSRSSTAAANRNAKKNTKKSMKKDSGKRSQSEIFEDGNNHGGGGYYRTILPLSLFFTGLTTLLFPMAAIKGGPSWASVDRFILGLLEGLLLPAAMAGVSDTTRTTTTSMSSSAVTNNSDRVTLVAGDSTKRKNGDRASFAFSKIAKAKTAAAGMETYNSNIGETTEKESSLGNNDNNKATASSIVIAGCYLGSAWAYLSASILFSEQSQSQLTEWGFLQQDGGWGIWPWVFYINGILSVVILVFFREEFCLDAGQLFGMFPRTEDDVETSIQSTNLERNGVNDRDVTTTTETNFSTHDDGNNNLWDETISIAKATLSSKSGRAILAAQIGQGALLYTIASWGPLYLERVTALSDATAGAAASTFISSSSSAALLDDTTSSSSSSSVSSAAVATSLAASSLILPQLTQAAVGVTIGTGADRLSSTIGTRLARRSLQIASGVGPAIVLWYLSQQGIGMAHTTDMTSGVLGGTDNFLATTMQSPPFLLGAAQTISALSLGAVSVSHLDVASPSSAGAVYALGNVAAAASGSLVVNIFGSLLEEATASDGENCASLSGVTYAEDAASGMDVAIGSEFAIPFRVVAILSAVGSLFYGCTVETELEIGVNETSLIL